VDVTSRSQRFTHPVRRATPTVAVGAHFPMAFGDRRQRRACAIVCPTVARSDRWLVGPSRLGGSCNRSISTERSRSSTSLTPVRASATSVSPRTMRRMWLTPSFTTGGHGVHPRASSQACPCTESQCFHDVEAAARWIESSFNRRKESLASSRRSNSRPSAVSPTLHESSNHTSQPMWGGPH